MLKATLLAISLIFDHSICVNISPSFKHHDYQELLDYLLKVNRDFPYITHLYSLGMSAEGRKIMAIAISSSKPSAHVLGRPEIKFIGNIHGNEVSNILSFC